MDGQSFGVSFIISRSEYLDYDLSVIDNTIKTLFNTGYKKLNNSYSDDECQVVYLIQLPVFTNSSLFKKFFEKLNKLLVVTRKYNSHIVNEPEASINDDR